MTKPEIENVEAQLAHNPQSAALYQRNRSLTDIAQLVTHWNGPPVAQSPAQELGVLQSDARYHCFERDWSPDPHTVVRGFSIMYHFSVGQSGRIRQMNPIERMLWHVTNGNWSAVGTLCIMGEGQRPSAAMLASLRALYDWLCADRPDLPNLDHTGVWGHGECGGLYGGGPQWGNSTTCPGPDLLAWTRAYRRGEAPPAPAPVPVPTATNHYFPETGYYVSDGFWEFYQSFGGAQKGVQLFGYPLAEPFQGRVGDWTGTVQQFERARFEYHPEIRDLPAPKVLLGRVVAEQLDAQHLATA